MDLYKAIQELYGEKDRLDRVIASLEELQRTAGATPEPPPAAKRRGRKSMPATERETERMKAYWAARRKARQKRAAEGQG
jgi:hypothetical protein